jgi:hypothetical protein
MRLLKNLAGVAYDICVRWPKMIVISKAKAH